MEFIVYLAGPISGLTYAHGQDWRDYVCSKLPREIVGMSPLRAKDNLADKGTIEGSYEDHPLTCSRGIITRDRNDCMRADALIINLLGATRVSIGTMIEIGWADSERVPIILVMEPGNIHEHPMVSECVGFRIATLDEAVRVCETVLLPGRKSYPGPNDSRFNTRKYPFTREVPGRVNVARSTPDNEDMPF